MEKDRNQISATTWFILLLLPVWSGSDVTRRAKICEGFALLLMEALKESAVLDHARTETI